MVTQQNPPISPIISCPVCQSQDHKLLYDFSQEKLEKSKSMATLENCVPGFILACNSCGMWYKQFEKNLGEVYSDEYAEMEIEGKLLSNERTYQFFHEILQKSKFYNKNSPKKPRLLDIGTGVGTLLEVAEKLGFEAEGIELCTKLADQARTKGLKVHTTDVEKLSSDKKFEVITILGVIEHLPKPLEVLQSLKELLVPEGELIIYTPNHKSPIVRMSMLLHAAGFNRPAENVFATNHVSFFEKRTLSEILEKTGFRERIIVMKPYDLFRPGMPISILNLMMISIIEYLGYFFTGSGFRLISYSDFKS